MSLERAKKLSQKGQLLEAEDLYWQEIESGNSAARLLLANAFYDAGLMSLALDHFLELEGTEWWNEAAPWASMIFLDVHEYSEARDVLSLLDDDLKAGSIAAIESTETKSAGYLGEIPGIVQDQLQLEAEMLDALSEELDVATQIQLTELRMYLAHYSSVIASGLGDAVASEGIEVGEGGIRVTRKLRDALGDPARRWFEAAHAAAGVFTLLHSEFPNEHEDFKEYALKAMSFIEKKYVISGRQLSEPGEDFVINNLIWALNEINSPAKDFYSGLLPES